MENVSNGEAVGQGLTPDQEAGLARDISVFEADLGGGSADAPGAAVSPVLPPGEQLNQERSRLFGVMEGQTVESQGAEPAAARTSSRLPTREIDGVTLPVVDSRQTHFIRELGKGMSGRVILTEAEGLGPVAIKFPHPDADSRIESEQEGRVIIYLMRQRPPINSVATLVAFPPEGETYLIKEFADGRVMEVYDNPERTDNRQRQLYEQDHPEIFAPSNGDRLGNEEAVTRARWAWGVLRVLRDLHRAGVTLGDSNTEDFILTADGTVKNVDLGNAGVSDNTQGRRMDCIRVFNLIVSRGFNLPGIPIPGSSRYSSGFRSNSEWREHWEARYQRMGMDRDLYAIGLQMYEIAENGSPIIRDGQVLMDNFKPYFQRIGLAEASLPEEETEKITTGDTDERVVEAEPAQQQGITTAGGQPTPEYPVLPQSLADEVDSGRLASLDPRAEPYIPPQPAAEPYDVDRILGPHSEPDREDVRIALGELRSTTRSHVNFLMRNREARERFLTGQSYMSEFERWSDPKLRADETSDQIDRDLTFFYPGMIGDSHLGTEAIAVRNLMGLLNASERTRVVEGIIKRLNFYGDADAIKDWEEFDPNQEIDISELFKDRGVRAKAGQVIGAVGRLIPGRGPKTPTEGVPEEVAEFGNAPGPVQAPSEETASPTPEEPLVSEEERAEVEANQYLEDLAMQIENYLQETGGIRGLDGFIGKSPALKGMKPAQKEALLQKEIRSFLTGRLAEAVFELTEGPEDAVNNPTINGIFKFLNHSQRVISLDRVQELDKLSRESKNA